MEKSLKKDIIINRLPVVIYFILIFAALMVIISAVAPMSNHEPKTTDTYSDFSTGWLNCEESEASLNHLSGTTVIHRTITRQLIVIKHCFSLQKHQISRCS